MNPEDLLHNIKELLGCINGVNVIEVKGNLEYLEVEFTVTDALSRLLIFYSAEAANVTLAVWSKYDPCSEESKLNPEEGLIYAFRSGSNSGAIDEFSSLGAHLTWSMYKCGLISSNEEQRYCELFRAISRSA
jgi:hypothetical protein